MNLAVAWKDEIFCNLNGQINDSLSWDQSNQSNLSEIAQLK